MYNIIIKNNNYIKKNLTLFFFVTIMLFTLSGCGLNKIKAEITENNRDSEKSDISIDSIKISGMSNEFCESINSLIKEDTEKELQIFNNISETEKNDRASKSVFKAKDKVMFNKQKLLSVMVEYYRYTSGIKGSMSRKMYNIDTASEKIINLCDVFIDDEYVSMLNGKLEQLSKTDMYSDLWQTPVIGEEQNESFYFADEGLVIVYPPYELSYYARGFVEFTVPYDELYGYIKPEYTLLYQN